MPRTAVRLHYLGLPLAAALLAACNKTSDTATPASSQSAATAGGSQATGAGTQDAQAMATDSAIHRVQAHIQETTGTKADSEAEARWTALADSVRQGLTSLSGMKQSDLRAVMPAHRQRLQRLIEVYRAMMASGRQARG